MKTTEHRSLFVEIIDRMMDLQTDSQWYNYYCI